MLCSWEPVLKHLMQGLAILFLKDQSKWFRFLGHVISIAATQLYNSSKKVAMENV